MNAILPIINLAIMDESPLTRLGIEQFVRSLHQGIRCHAQATSVGQLGALIQASPTDLVISGLSGAQETARQGAEKLMKMASAQPEIRQIIYTHSHSGELLHTLRTFPQVSLISRQETQKIASECFMQALTGFRACSPLIQNVIDEHVRESYIFRQNLTAREYEVLKHLFCGMGVKEMAKHLNRSIKTISAHKCNAMQKLGVSDDNQLFSLSARFTLNTEGSNMRRARHSIL